MTHNARMGLLQKIFSRERGEGGPASQPPSSQFHETETTQNGETGSRNAPRRELVQVILRDTMRKHGIPSDWIECRILSTISRSGRNGMHVNFVVRQAHDQLLAYVFAFQESFERELARFEPQSKDWLFTLGWEFEGRPRGPGKKMPDPSSWRAPAAAGAAAEGADTDPLEADTVTEDDVEEDLQALYAIRDAALRPKAPEPQHPDFEPTRPGSEESGSQRSP